MNAVSVLLWGTRLWASLGASVFVSVCAVSPSAPPSPWLGKGTLRSGGEGGSG